HHGDRRTGTEQLRAVAVPPAHRPAGARLRVGVPAGETSPLFRDRPGPAWRPGLPPLPPHPPHGHPAPPPTDARAPPPRPARAVALRRARATAGGHGIPRLAGLPLLRSQRRGWRLLALLPVARLPTEDAGRGGFPLPAGRRGRGRLAAADHGERDIGSPRASP